MSVSRKEVQLRLEYEADPRDEWLGVKSTSSSGHGFVEDEYEWEFPFGGRVCVTGAIGAADIIWDTERDSFELL